MTEFVLTYRNPPDYVGSPDALATWDEWFDSLGRNLIDRGNPVFVHKTLGNYAETALGGYSLIKADDLNATVALATGCPVLNQGGGVEVGELTILNRGTTRASKPAKAAGRRR
jgi:hypothetical protein